MVRHPAPPGRQANIQLSGGEPTVRDDLPDIIRLGREKGFTYFQLNTNGLRLAREPGYAQKLKQAGLNCVFLQFDGVTNGPYQALRGAPLLEEKKRAIQSCAAARLGVVLVPVVAPGINLDQLGAILDFALEWLPVVRGVHFQPITYFGRFPGQPHTPLTLPAFCGRSRHRPTAVFMPQTSPEGQRSTPTAPSAATSSWRQTVPCRR